MGWGLAMGRLTDPKVLEEMIMNERRGHYLKTFGAEDVEYLVRVEAYINNITNAYKDCHETIQCIHLGCAVITFDGVMRSFVLWSRTERNLSSPSHLTTRAP